MPTLKVGLKITVQSTARNPLDSTYVVERITRSTSPTTPPRYVVEARTERQRCYDRMLTGYTSWDLSYMQECFRAGSMEVCP